MPKPERDDRSQEPKLPSPHDWRTTDQDEINKRRQRARDETFAITNLQPRHPIFSNFRVGSASGLTYAVEVRDLQTRQFTCDCVDFRINGLGTCKHVEAVLLHLETRFRRLFARAQREGSPRIEVYVDRAADTLRVSPTGPALPRAVARWFDNAGGLDGASAEDVLTALQKLQATDLPHLRLSQEIIPWIENRRRIEERKALRHDYEMKVQSGQWPAHETKVPLFPYQREGMLHLAFAERALLADEMGLGKTIQAIAACALLHRLGQAHRVLVVTPASLKTEWEEQIQRFTELPYQLVFGGRSRRLKAYTAAGPGSACQTAPPGDASSPAQSPFFTIVNYEQMVADALDVNAQLQPDIVVLDEAQRIKNWSTKTAQAVKRLRSRYAFVLTGTPIENRIDELHSLMDFLNPAVLGPLFRFNRDFYELDDRGRPCGYRNLGQLHARIKPLLLRRRKADVETELPARTDRNHFVRLSPLQQENYDYHEAVVARLLHIAKRRPLSQPEQDKLQRELAMMRMICDTNFILDPEERGCPKLGELAKVLEECRDNDAKVIVFSEWERMLQLVRDLCERLRLGFAWHTGSVPQLRRRAEINAFKTSPDCRVFLSTDSGATGLNLQTASVVVNCDLPWNPAKLEQRIARAWRKNQTRPVTVINLVSENTIEHRMLDTLANKQALAEGVLDLKGDLTTIPLRGGKQSFLARLQQLIRPALPTGPAATAQSKPPVPSDRPLAFAQRARDAINGALVRCEERYPQQGDHAVLLVVVEQNPAQHQQTLQRLHGDLFGPGQIDPLTPVHLEVIDRATHDALERLVTAGLIQSSIRVSRSLWPAPEPAPAPPPLSAEEKACIDQHRAQAQRKLKMGRLLGEGGLDDEARAPILEAMHYLGRAAAVEQRLPEPDDVKDVLLPPLSHHWGEAAGFLRAFVADPHQPWKPVFEQLENTFRS
jgi:superfamily II DNA or RNA helicase